MAEYTREDHDREDHDKITEMHAVLLGINGSPGLCRLVERNSRAIFKLWCCFIVTAVSIGGGAFGIVKAVLAVNGG